MSTPSSHPFDIGSATPLAELHVHLFGCVGPAERVRFVAASSAVDWEWYEDRWETAFGVRPPTRELVDRFRAGDNSVLPQLYDICVFGDADAGSFDRFTAKSGLIWAATDYEPDCLEHDALTFARGVQSGFAEQGLAYAEFRSFALPGLLASFANEAGPLISRLAVSIPRTDPWETWEAVKGLTLGPDGHALTAIDFSGIEEGTPPKQLSDFFSAVRKFNRENPSRALAVLYHVGESFRDKSLESAIRWVQEAAQLGAHRLGHAIALGVDPAMYGRHAREERVSERVDQIAYDLSHQDALRDRGVDIDVEALEAEAERLGTAAEDAVVRHDYDEARLEEIRRRQLVAMEAVRDTGAVVEVCPTSNRRIGGLADPAQHPVHRFVEMSLPFIVSTDNPGVFEITIGQELAWVCEATGGGETLRDQLIERAWTSRSEVLSGRTIHAATPDSQSPQT